MKKLLIAAMLIVGASAQAHATFFNDASAFSATNPGLPSLDFEGIAPSGDFVEPGSFSAPNLSVTSPTGRIAISDSLFFFGTPTDVLFDDTFGGTIILDFGPGVSAVGFNVGVGFSGGTGNFTVFTSGGVADIQSLLEPDQSTMAGFVGWSGLGDITRITFNTDGSSFPLIDNLQYAHVTAVPEPASIALFAAGLLSLGWLNGRRKAR